MNKIKWIRESKRKTPEQLSSEFQTTCLVIISTLVYLCIAPYILYFAGRVFSFWLYFVNIIITLGLTLAMPLFYIGLMIYHLFIYWKSLIWRSRLARLTVCICLAIIPVCFLFSAGLGSNPGAQANLTGLRDGVLSKKPDISAIRKWMDSLDIPSGASSADIDIQTAPHFIKSLAPNRIVVYKTNIHNDKQLFRSVSFEWYAFAIVGMAIGPPEMGPPNGFDIRLIEPGAYIYFLAE